MMHRLKSDFSQNGLNRKRNEKFKIKESSNKIVMHKKKKQTTKSQDSKTNNMFEDNSSSVKENYKNFNDFPDEIILRILSFLPKLRVKSLCTRVCKRWNELSNDSYVWKNVVYGKEIIEVIDVQEIITRGVDQLDLSKSMLKDYVPLFPVSFKPISFNQRFSKLQYLHLDDSVYPLPEYEFRHTLSKLTADILSVCSCLKVLKLRKIWLSSDILSHISENKNIRELYWISCLIYLDTVSEDINFRNMCINCQKLKVVDFSNTYLPVTATCIFCDYVPSSVKFLTLCTLDRKRKNFRNSMKGIIERCPNIEHLKIGYSGRLNDIIFVLIIKGLRMLKSFDVSSFGRKAPPIEVLSLFRKSPNLTELIIAQNLYSLSDIIELKDILKDVKISLIEMTLV